VCVCLIAAFVTGYGLLNHQVNIYLLLLLLLLLYYPIISNCTENFEVRSELEVDYCLSLVG